MKIENFSKGATALPVINDLVNKTSKLIVISVAICDYISIIIYDTER